MIEALIYLNLSEKIHVKLTADVHDINVFLSSKSAVIIIVQGSLVDKFFFFISLHENSCTKKWILSWNFLEKGRENK